MYMFFYTNRKQKIVTSHGVDDVHTPARDTVWKDVTFCIEGGQTGFLNFYSINYMVSGFESVESSRG